MLFLSLAPVLSVYPAESAESTWEGAVGGDPTAGKAKSEAELCQGCHGEAGLSIAVGAPNLAGQQAAYLVKQLRDFRSEARRHHTMNAMAGGLADADIADIAAYFASLPPMKGEPAPENAAVRDLFLYGDVQRDLPACVECHELGGAGRIANGVAYPRIGGQVRGYLRVQLLNWKIGARANSPEGVMNKVAGALTEAEIEALAAFLSGL
jgi:cytochrome c553